MTDYRTRSSGTRTAAAAERWPNDAGVTVGCRNLRYRVWKLVFKDSVAQITLNCEAIASRENTSHPRRHTLNESLYRTKKEQSFELLFFVPHRARPSNFYRWLLKDFGFHRVVKSRLPRKGKISYKNRLTSYPYYLIMLVGIPLTAPMVSVWFKNNRNKN